LIERDYGDRLENGLDTEISQNTSGVSGGQSQIIAFIRALLSEKDMIILDEPISSVDVETRGLILSILDKRDYDGILIVISHQTEGLDFLRKVIKIR
jgi:ATP-binding cassette subfamily B protein